MRPLLILSSALLISTASAAFAQSGAPVPLNEQLRRLQKNGGAPATVTTPTTAPAERKTFTAPKEMPAQAPMGKTAPAARSAGTPGLQPGEVIDSTGGGAIPALPLELMTENGISYLSGGIGDEEIAQMNAQEAQFNLHVVITNDSGDFASNVVLNLKDAKGKTLVSINDAGPKLLVRLPAGHYTIETNAGGSVKTLAVNVPAKGTAKSQIHI